MQTYSVVPRPHYSMPSTHFGSRGHVSQLFILHTSPKCIDREGVTLERRRTGTRQAFSGLAEAKITEKSNVMVIIFALHQIFVLGLVMMFNLFCCLYFFQRCCPILH